MAPLVSRITFTLSVVNASRRIVFLITGADKADAVARAFSGAPDPAAPASLVDGEVTVLLWMVEQEKDAAGDLMQRGLVARREEQESHGDQLVLVEALACLLRRDERREQAVARACRLAPDLVDPHDPPAQSPQ